MSLFCVALVMINYQYKKGEVMAKDDYDVLVFKILTYFYGVLKRKIAFTDASFKAAIKFNDISEEYLNDVIYMMEEDGYISGMAFEKAWGNNRIALGDFSDIRISSKGIDYIQNNSNMHKVKEYFLEHPELITSLITALFI